MELKVYSVYDSKTQAYMSPWFARSRGEAIRSFTEAVNDPKSMFHKYPADFTMFELGTWDDQAGTVTLDETKQNIGLATHFKRVDDQLDTPVQRGVEPAN